MLNSLRYPVIFTLTLVLFGCGQPPQSAAPTAAGEAQKRAVAMAADNSIGIPECDDYLAKYEACLASKVPETTRATLVQSLDQTRAAWRSSAGNAGAKEILASTCKQTREAMKTSMAAYGCTDF